LTWIVVRDSLGETKTPLSGAGGFIVIDEAGARGADPLVE